MLKDVLEPERIKFMTSLSKMHILINKMIYLINIIINIIAQLK